MQTVQLSDEEAVCLYQLTHRITDLYPDNAVYHSVYTIRDKVAALLTEALLTLP